MKNLTNFIQEGLKIGKDWKHNKIKYQYFPKNKIELIKLLDKLINERGVDANLNDIDTSNITNMDELFPTVEPGNIDVSEWNVSNVETMVNMFYDCDKLNCDFSKWDVSNVKNMNGMFKYCDNFEGIGLENWDVSNVEDARSMFYHDHKFEGSKLDSWDILLDNKCKVSRMFHSCKNYPKWFEM